jgi:hypothetical protein
MHRLRDTLCGGGTRVQVDISAHAGGREEVSDMWWVQEIGYAVPSSTLLEKKIKFK